MGYKEGVRDVVEIKREKEKIEMFVVFLRIEKKNNNPML